MIDPLPASLPKGWGRGGKAKFGLSFLSPSFCASARGVSLCWEEEHHHAHESHTESACGAWKSAGWKFKARCEHMTFSSFKSPLL